MIAVMSTVSNRYRLVAAAILLLHAALLGRLLLTQMGRTIDVEEGFVAYAASELRAGPSEPWTAYVKTHYEHGGLLMSVLTAPVFAVLGETWLALKLVSLLWSVATVALVISLGRACFDERTGLIAGALLAAGPPDWLVSGVQTVGNTQEALLPILLQWRALLWLEQRPESAGRAVALGLACGFAIAFSLAALPSTALLTAVWLRRHGKPGARALGIGAAAGIGALVVPLINLRHGIVFWRWRGAELHQLAGGPGSWTDGVVALTDPRTVLDLLGALDLGRMLPGAVWLVRAFWCAVLVAWIAAMLRARRGEARDGVIAAWLALYLLAYFVNTRRVGYYVLLLLPASALLLGRALALMSPRRRACCGLGLMLSLLLPWGAAMVAPAAQPAWDAPPVDAGRWRHRVETFAARWTEAIERGDAAPDDPTEAHAVGMLLGERGADPKAFFGWPPIAAREAARGYGHGRAWIAWETTSCAALIEGMPQELGRAALRGYGRCLGESRWIEDRVRPERFAGGGARKALDGLAKGLDVGARRALCIGLGEGLGMRFWHRPEAFDDPLRLFPRRDWPALRVGLIDRLRRVITDAERRRAVYRALAAKPLLAPGDGPAPGEEDWEGGAIVIELELARARGTARLEKHALHGVGGAPAWARWDLPPPRPGRYELWLSLAAAKDREVLWALVGGEPAVGPVPLQRLARYGADVWLRLGELDLKERPTSLVLMSERAFPRIDRVRLVRVGK